MSANTLEVDSGNNRVYPKVLSLYETVISVYLLIPEGIITVRDSDLCHMLSVPEGTITVRDSDLCHMLSVPEGTITVRDSDLGLLW